MSARWGDVKERGCKLPDPEPAGGIMAAYMEHGHDFKVIEIPFSPFQNEFGDDDDDDDDGGGGKERRFEYIAALRRSSVGYGSRRQEFLRSYTFCRPTSAAKPTVQERVQSRFKSLWVAAVACNPSNLPRRVRRLRDKLALKSARHSLQRSSRNHTAGARSVPFLQQCFRA